MRHYDRVQCLAILDYNAGGIVIGARCMKDARHGHGTDERRDLLRLYLRVCSQLRGLSV